MTAGKNGRHVRSAAAYWKYLSDHEEVRRMNKPVFALVPAVACSGTAVAQGH
jgi:hypothetical protein